MSASHDPPSRSLRRRVALGLGVFSLSTAAVVALTEVFARVADPFGISYYKDTNRYLNEAIVLPPEAGRPDGRLFENKPAVDMRLRTFSFRTDGRGLRSATATERAPGPAGGELRVLFLGDSVTLAWGVEQADSWVRIVEREGRTEDGSALECLNAGHLQYNTTQEADWLDAHGPALGPDVVVLTFVVNDLDDAYALYRRFMEDLETARSRERSWLDGLRERLPVWFRGLHGLWNYRAEQATARTAADRELERVEDAPGYTEAWQRCAEALERIRRRCAELGAELVVFDHTTPRIGDVRGWCEAHAVPWYDFTFTPEEWQRDVRNSPADAHANALGNRLLADKALRALAAAGHLRTTEPR